MSAYIVSTDTIDLILSVAQMVGRTSSNLYLGEDRQTVLNLQTHARQIGQILVDENFRSVNSRYRLEDAAPVYRFRHVDTDRAGAGMDPAILVLGSIRCLRYQSCEADGYRETNAAQILDAIESMAIRHLCNVHESPWGWTRDWAAEKIAKKKTRINASMGLH